MNYDIIGDIHGQSEKLDAMLRHMGYRPSGGAWRHPERTAVFVGDFIDRGPGQLATLRRVRAMVDSGSALAVMGNHEFNAIAWATEDPSRPGKHLRRHTDKNLRQHAAFLAEVADRPDVHRAWTQWFLDLPLWLDLQDCRIIHACWHEAEMAALAPRLRPGNRLTPELVEAASREGSAEFRAVETLIKGLEVRLPAPHVFIDKEGHERKKVRVRWWDPGADTFRRAAIMDADDDNTLPDTLVPPEARMGYTDAKPVFFGHYWRTGTPRILAPNACCVDFSAARASEPLVAYRHEGELELTNTSLVAVGGTEPGSRRTARP